MSCRLDKMIHWLQVDEITLTAILSSKNITICISQFSLSIYVAIRQDKIILSAPFGDNIKLLSLWM